MTATHRALRHYFRLDGSGPVRDLVERIMSPLADSSSAAPLATYSVEMDGDQAVTRVDAREVDRNSLGAVLSALVTRVNVAAIESVGERLVAHAAVVSVERGAILIPANPGAGKSTLCAALVDAGCAYLSDEAAPLAGGEVIPYPKPIVVGSGSFSALADLRVADLGDGLEQVWFLDPARLAGGVEHAERPVRLVVVPQYDPGVTVGLSKLSAGEVTAAIASNTFNMKARGRQGLETCAAVARNAIGFRIVHGNARDAAQVIKGLIES